MRRLLAKRWTALAHAHAEQSYSHRAAAKRYQRDAAWILPEADDEREFDF